MASSVPDWSGISILIGNDSLIDARTLRIHLPLRFWRCEPCRSQLKWSYPAGRSDKVVRQW